MKTIYFVRHGESTGNAERTAQGPETPLSESGRAQAEAVGERVATLGSVDVVLASTWARAKETAEIIASRIGRPLELYEDLGERRRPSSDVGESYESSKIKESDNDFLANLDNPQWRCEDAETFADLKARAFRVMKLIQERPENSLVVVTHGVFLRLLIGAILFGEAYAGKEFAALFRKLLMTNTGITVVRYDQSDQLSPWRLLTWNDHAHLD